VKHLEYCLGHPVLNIYNLLSTISLTLCILVSILVAGCNGGGGSDEGTFSNLWPIAGFTADITRGALPLTVHFDAGSSFDPDGTIVSYDWDFGDGNVGSGNPITYEYQFTGIFTVTLIVTDDEGEEAEATFSIEVIRTIWTFVVDKPVYYSAPAVGRDGTIYFATGILIHSSSGSLYAVSSEGTLKWKFDLDNNSDDDDIWTNDNNGASPAIAADGTIFLIDHRNVVYAVNPDGTLKWKKNTYEGGRAWHVGQKTPAIGTDGTLYFCVEFTLYALDPEDGREKWQLPNLRGGNVCAVSAVVGADGTIYLAMNEMFYAVNPDGTLKWPAPFQRLYENEKSYSSPAIGADGTIYFGSEGTSGQQRGIGYLYAVNPDGTGKWQYTVPGERAVRASPAIAADGTIYVTTKAYWDDGKKPALCLALDPEDGSLIWSYNIQPKDGIPVAQDSYTSPAVGADGTIYFAAENNYIYALNPDGTLRWKEDTHNGLNWSSPAIMPDGTLYIGGLHNTLENQWAGKFMAIRTESYGLADSPWPKFRHDNSNTGRFSP